jgi:voltage-gated potassium channel
VSKHFPVWRVIALAAAIVFGGAIGYSAFEHIDFRDSLYQATITFLTHVDRVDPADDPGRAVNLVLILANFAFIGYLLKVLAEYMISASINVQRRRLQTKINRLKQHYIVCGLGRVGSQIAREMAIEEVPFVGLDRDQAKVDDATSQGYLAFQADTTAEEAMKMAGIERAAGFVASLGDDSANLLAVLTARSLNPDIYIVARANRQENEVKLKRAGADRVALPYQIGGYHMASMALRPSVVDYMDIVSKSGASTDLQVEEMVVSEQSRLAGHHLGKALVEGEIGATVIAINGSDGTSRVRPTGHEVIYPGDRLIILGSKPDLTKASELIR